MLPTYWLLVWREICSLRVAGSEWSPGISVGSILASVGVLALQEDTGVVQRVIGRPSEGRLFVSLDLTGTSAGISVLALPRNGMWQRARECIGQSAGRRSVVSSNGMSVRVLCC